MSESVLKTHRNSTSTIQTTTIKMNGNDNKYLSKSTIDLQEAGTELK